MEERGAPRQPSVRCLVVGPHGPDGKPVLPDDLLSSLAKHDVAVALQPSVFAAIGAMTQHQRLVRKGLATEGMALVVVDPERVTRAEDLVHASERYAPSVVCWRYDSHTRMKLHAYQVRKRDDRADEEADAAHRPSSTGPAGKAAKPVVTVRPVAAPSLRLAGAETDGTEQRRMRLRGEDEDVRPRHAGSANDATQLLTEEELAMLLGDEKSGDIGGSRPR